jgi:hypothetical protein
MLAECARLWGLIYIRLLIDGNGKQQVQQTLVYKAKINRAANYNLATYIMIISCQSSMIWA